MRATLKVFSYSSYSIYSQLFLLSSEEVFLAVIYLYFFLAAALYTSDLYN